LETIQKRLRLLGCRPLDILLLGDDDLLSIAMAHRHARRRIVVADEDQMLLARISNYAATVESVEHDLRLALPRQLRFRFDEVFTDPPYTLAGQLLFVHRAVWALKVELGASLYLVGSTTYLTRAHLEATAVFLRAAGFELGARHQRFNRYEAPPDVRKDLQQRGSRATRWLESDLFHYVRHRPAGLPPLPAEARGDIYDYGRDHA
jgi:predicted methyltransferase